MRRTLAIFALASVALAACSETTEPTVAIDSVTGTYTLLSYNGLPLPAITSQTTAQRTEVTADALTIFADGSFRETSLFRITTADSVTTNSAVAGGIFYVVGDGLRLTYTNPPSGVALATFSGTTMTLNAGSAKLVFVKQ